MNGPVNPEPASNDDAAPDAATAEQVPGATSAADPKTVATSSGERAIEPAGGAEASRAHAEHADQLEHRTVEAERPGPRRSRPSKGNG